jgi:hypothetical protein
VQVFFAGLGLRIAPEAVILAVYLASNGGASMEITTPDDLVPADVELVGLDGNAGSIMAAVSRGLRQAGNPPEVIEAFCAEAMSGDYDHLLQAAIAYAV